MTPLYWHTTGSGTTELVLLHGWGLNSQVWSNIVPRLAPHFRLHLVDLPGYGRSQGFGALTLEQMAETVAERAPEHAWWLGWSLGGLVASQAALTRPHQVDGLVTVASSPRFSATGRWPGITPEILADFQRQLSEDYHRTVERFLALQTLGTETARQDARRLKQVVLEQPLPSVDVLTGGLDILRTSDLRQSMAALDKPFLRLYGHLDGLVPRKVAASLDSLWPQSRSYLFAKAAHAPFISHPELFCQRLVEFINP